MMMKLLGMFGIWLWIAGAHAAHTRATLLLDSETATPGSQIWAGVQLRMDPKWHTYWKNSGDSGMPTSIEWDLPAGVSAGEIQWPPPDKLEDGDLTTYVYYGEVVLLVPLRLSKEIQTGTLDLKAKVSWLECEVQCVPGESAVSAKLTIGAAPKPSAAAGLITGWQKRLPGNSESLAAKAFWENPGANDARKLIMEWNSSPGTTNADFFPGAIENIEVRGATGQLPTGPGKLRISKQLKKLSGSWPDRIAGVIVELSGAGRTAFEVSLRITDGGGGTGVATSGPPPGKSALSGSLWLMLLYAFVGGVILNVMPCVLPVIALKILGFVSQAKDEPGQVRKLGLIYTVGVLASFAALAGMVIGVKAAGHKAGWGMQFGNPQFLLILMVIVTLVALNLFGLFEVTLSGRVMGAAGGLASRHGASGAFFNGVLATVLATPCTAPFLGAALGFAFAQPPATILLIFLTVGLGLAFPYVLLSWNPAWLKFLPKPGMWMERFKIAMGFPMLATAFWIFSLMPIHYGDRAWWAGIFLTIVASAAWVFGEFVQRGRVRRALAMGTVIALLVGGYAAVVEGQLRWRSPETGTPQTATLAHSPGGLEWQPWSHEAVAAARASGKMVLVDFTARWCLTCNTVVKPALESDSVRKRVKELGVVALLADYTRFPPVMTEELNKFGRAGVPLVLVYPKDPTRDPIVLPEALTPGMVVSALDKAAQ